MARVPDNRVPPGVRHRRVGGTVAAAAVGDGRFDGPRR
jgi:hypothetical protein